METLISSLLSGLDSSVISSTIKMSKSLSSQALNSAITEISTNLPKFKKLSKVARPKALEKVMTKYNEAYPPVVFSTSNKVSRSRKPVYQYTKDGVFVAEFPTVQNAYKTLGIAGASIWRCANHCKGFNTAGGYKWSFSKD